MMRWSKNGIDSMLPRVHSVSSSSSSMMMITIERNETINSLDVSTFNISSSGFAIWCSCYCILFLFSISLTLFSESDLHHIISTLMHFIHSISFIAQCSSNNTNSAHIHAYIFKLKIFPKNNFVIFSVSAKFSVVNFF